MSDKKVAQTPIKMRYKNWRGEVSNRSILPVGTLERKATEYHPEPQWIMRAWDFDKQAYRDFALADCDFAAMQPTPQKCAECDCDGGECTWIASPKVTPQEAARVLLDACPNPLFDTLKPKLMGEFSQQYPVFDEDGEEFMARVNISWTVIKEVIHTTLRAIAGEARHD